ncbi:hypothetical protein H4582DRAFT_1823847 [Lactarius indigo]|nr:hypothetical protein H4582DRAFT_1823847 [Lactarius indigo]
MSTGKVQSIDHVLRVLSERHMSLAAILEMVRKAGCGIYRPKGFEEEGDLQTLLLLRLRGQRVAEIAHRMFGIPAPSAVHHRTLIPPPICSVSCPLEVELVSNLKAAFEDLLPALAVRWAIHVVLMIDEIAQERQPRWCDRTNKIIGCCREHTKRRCMEFNSIADAELLLQDVARGSVHLAHGVALLSNNSRFYCATPFLISGSCRKEAVEDHAVLIQTALNAINRLKALSNTRVVCIASDGRAKQGKALAQLTFKHTLLPTSPIYRWLSACSLLDLCVGDDEMTCDGGWKHAGAKRPRSALLRDKDVLVYGTWITPTVLRSHLLEAGHKSDHIRTVLNHNDKQDVMPACNLLHDVWALPGLGNHITDLIYLHLSGAISDCVYILEPKPECTLDPRGVEGTKG